MASEAAVCLSSCGVSPSKPAVTAAGLNTSLRKFRFRSTPPRAPVNMRSFGPLPALRTSSSSTRNLGIGTDLRWCRCRTHPGPHGGDRNGPVSYTHLRAHETDSYLVCRLLLEKKKKHELREPILSKT